MNPLTILSSLCAHFDVPVAKGQKLIPLIERALEAPEPIKGRILSLVKRTLKREAERHRAAERERDLDERMLGVVAKVVHPWTPPNWLRSWSKEDESGNGPQRGIA